MNDSESLDIPAFLLIPAYRRKEAWLAMPPGGSKPPAASDSYRPPTAAEVRREQEERQRFARMRAKAKREHEEIKAQGLKPPKRSRKRR